MQVLVTKFLVYLVWGAIQSLCFYIALCVWPELRIIVCFVFLITFGFLFIFYAYHPQMLSNCIHRSSYSLHIRSSYSLAWFTKDLYHFFTVSLLMHRDYILRPTVTPKNCTLALKPKYGMIFSYAHLHTSIQFINYSNISTTIIHNKVGQV